MNRFGGALKLLRCRFAFKQINRQIQFLLTVIAVSSSSLSGGLPALR